MATIISSKTAGIGGLNITGDASGVLALASGNGVTGLSISASQDVTFTNPLTSTSLITPTITSGTLITPTIDSAPVPTVVGTAPIYMCRAWVNFNGTGTVAIRASGNVSSITDNGVGDYTLNFTTAMVDVNYSLAGSAKWDSGAGDSGSPLFGIRRVASNPAIGSVRLALSNSATFSGGDAETITAAIFR
jgi:hypothetical protein